MFKEINFHVYQFSCDIYFLQQLIWNQTRVPAINVTETM